MIKRRKRFLILILFFLFTFMLHLLIQKIFYNKDLEISHSEDRKLLCVTSNLGLVLPLADGLMMEPHLVPIKWPFYHSNVSEHNTDRRIFFHETSGLNELSLRQCCAVESAAKHHPDRPIQLFLRPPDCSSWNISSSLLHSLFNPKWLEVLSEYPNVAVILMNEDHYFTRTPLEEWYRKGEWRKSQFEMAHLSDYIRILTMYKGGGMYLDMDILTLKSFHGDQFRNFLVYGNAGMEEISNGVMHLESGHWLAGEIIRLIAKEYDPEAYVYHGPDAVSEVMNRVCELMAGNPLSNQCADVRLLSDHLFYPISSIFSHVLFQNNNEKKLDVETLNKIRGSFGLHLWHSLSRLHEPIDINSNQIIAIIARQHCPLTVASAADFKSF